MSQPRAQANRAEMDRSPYPNNDWRRRYLVSAGIRLDSRRTPSFALLASIFWSDRCLLESCYSAGPPSMTFLIYHFGTGYL
jgi:hypothetical protein